MHRPAELRDTKAPALIYYHGGGHCIGSLNTHRLACRQLSVAARCVVIAVDYRLAPEHKFPTGINDCLAVFDGVVQRSEEFGVAPEKIAVGGDSAGANISAVVAQQRKEPEYSPCFQLLIVPWLDLSKQARSYELFEKGFQLDKYTMEWYTNHYLVRPEDSLNPMASPALGEVEGVCPAAVIVAGFDPLRDEGLEYGNRLLAAGVDTTVRLHEGLIHPFMNFSGHVPVARSAFEDLARLLKDALYC
jgi:acetyl esterase